MREDVGRFQPKSVAWINPGYSFIRKGKVGDHATLFSAEQRTRFDVAMVDAFGPDASPPFLP
jgi:hypothetical protein